MNLKSLLQFYIIDKYMFLYTPMFDILHKLINLNPNFQENNYHIIKVNKKLSKPRE